MCVLVCVCVCVCVLVCVCGCTGTDRDGFPVLIERIGQSDLLNLLQVVGEAAFLDWVVFYHETQERMMREASVGAGTDRHQLTVIIDLIGRVHISPSVLSLLKTRARLEEDHYPEVVRRIFLINVPAAFTAIWQVVAYFLDEGTRTKFQLLSSSYLGTLLQFVAAEQLPGFLGGSLVDANGDPECASIVSPGGTHLALLLYS